MIATGAGRGSKASEGHVDAITGTRANTTATLLVVVVAAACGAGETAADGPTVRDSAGVRIVDNAPVDTAAVWRVGEEPVLEIGAVQGSVEYQLDGVTDVARAPNGTILVAERGSRQLSVFDSAGEHLRTAGGEGGGPGEFRRLSELAWLPGDTLAAWDGRQGRISLFTAGGVFVRSRTLSPPDDAVTLQFLGVLANGDAVGGGLGRFGGEDGPSDGRYRRPLSIHRYGGGQSPGPRLTRIPGDEMFRTSYRSGGREGFLLFPHPFGTSTSTAVGGERVCVSTGERFGIRCRSPDGRLLTVVRDSVRRRPVTDEAIDRLLESRLADIEHQDLRRRVRESFESVRDFPDRMPALDRLLIGSEGDLWVRAYRPEYEEGGRRWTVFGPDGIRRARVTMPPKFRPYVIERDLVVGQWTDELGVNFVRVYRLGR